MNDVILITGMSGTGKSTVIDTLVKRGYKAIDMDYNGFSYTDDNRIQLWNEEKVNLLISDNRELLFIAGCSESQVKYYKIFKEIILLTAPLDVIKNRIMIRSNNNYGKDPSEWQDIVSNYKKFNESLRKAATLILETTAENNIVVDTIVEFIRPTSRCRRSP